MISRILSFDPSKKRKTFGEKISQRVVLLQGPVGPFFNHLQNYLEANDLEVWRICFNAGDMFYSTKRNRIPFSGTLNEWRGWFSVFVKAAKIDLIILFGAERPVHRIARRIARMANVRVISLEEGYIRPGYVTIEEGGNNATSPLAGCLPPNGSEALLPGEVHEKDYKSFRPMCRHSAVYYTIRTLFAAGKQRYLFHRRFSFGHEVFCWVRNYWRKLMGQGRNFKLVQRLLEHFDGKYYLVPLQVATDSQMKEAALGWDSTKLIAATLESFARHATRDSRLVFKIHPLERGHTHHRLLIESSAQAFGISARVDVIDTGSLGLLTRHAAGMITINSSSGLSAIFHGIPLLVVGNAFYAHDDLAVCGRGKPDFDSFWSCRLVADETERKYYIHWIKQQALKPGDFYAQGGIEAACQGVLERILEDTAITQQESDPVRATC